MEGCMNQYEIFETKERVTADNDREADKVRSALTDRNVFLVNLMSSPGAGKTTTLVRTINALKDQYRIGVMSQCSAWKANTRCLHLMPKSRLLRMTALRSRTAGVQRRSLLKMEEQSVLSSRSARRSRMRTADSIRNMTRARQLQSRVSMCKDKAPEAAETTAEFAAYLRGNLDSLSIKEPIPFAKELDHTANFIALEKRRFGDRINVNYDIQTDAFTIPALSLQPLVENSIKHGLLVKEEGGSITITAREAENEYILTVQDDGVGFDAAAVQNDGQIHVGIDNVRKRLDFMCHGTLEIQSEIGQGTTSTIRIPKLSGAGK